MNSLPPDSSSTPAPAAASAVWTDDCAALGRRWAALHEAAGIVATLAGLDSGAADSSDSAFTSAMRGARGWRRHMAEQGLDDLSMIMQTGISALLSAHAGGTQTAAPARALWDEFVAARDALLQFGPPPQAERRPLA